MKKLLDSRDGIVEDMINGLVSTYPHLARVKDQPVIVRSESPLRDRVSLVSGGGSGHEPAHAGYVGKGMLTAAVLGQIFTSPT